MFLNILLFDVKTFSLTHSFTVAHTENKGLYSFPKVFCGLLIFCEQYIFREKEVYQHLQEYLNRARRLSERKEDMTEVCVLCLHCIEVSVQKYFVLSP